MNRLLVGASLLVLATPLRAQNRDSLALTTRANQIGRVIDGATPSLDTIFTATFLQQVPPSQMTALAKQLSAMGRVKQVAWIGASPDAPGATRFRIETDKGYGIPMTLVIEPTGARLVVGLLFGAPTLT